MKNFRNAIAAPVLAIVLSASAFADEGVLHTDKTPPPPPPVQAPGTIHTGDTAPAPQGDVLTDIALNVLQNLLMLL